jgi:hypothetical protein
MYSNRSNKGRHKTRGCVGKETKKRKQKEKQKPTAIYTNIIRLFFRALTPPYYPSPIIQSYRYYPKPNQNTPPTGALLSCTWGHLIFLLDSTYNCCAVTPTNLYHAILTFIGFSVTTGIMPTAKSLEAGHRRFFESDREN